MKGNKNNMKFEEFKIEHEKQENAVNKLEIRQYVPLTTKKMIAEIIAEKCVVKSSKENINLSMFEIDYVHLIVSKMSAIISAYTDLKLSEDAYTEIDYLKSEKIYEAIITIIKDDVKELDEIIDKELENKLKAQNSIEGILINTVNTLISKIPDEKTANKFIGNFIKKIDKVIKNIKPEQIEELKKLTNGR
jgi:hypothetical protein